MSEIHFAVIARARTGSNNLCSLIGSHPDVLCHHEAFARPAPYLARRTKQRLLAEIGGKEVRDRDPWAYLQALYDHDFGHRAVGFKYLHNQRPRLLARVLGDPSIKKIVLSRRSRLANYVSTRRARLSGHHHSGTYDGLRVHVEPEEFVDWARSGERFYAEVRHALRGQEHLHLTYEEVSAGGVMPRVFAFLGVDPTFEAESAYRKQSRGGLRAAVRNFDALRGALAGTVFADELEACPAPSAAGDGAR